MVAKHYPVTFYPLAAYDTGKICGILPLYHVRTRLRKSALISVPYAVAGGITGNDAAIRTLLLERAIELGRELGGCRITLKQYKSKVEGALLTDTHFYNRELSLSTDLDAIFNGLSETNKNAISQAEKHALSLEYPSQDIDGFFRLLLKHHHRRGLPCVSKRWITDLVGCGMYSFGLIKHEGKSLAGTMVKEFKDTISFPFTCVNAEHYEAYAPRALYWELIKHFAAQGKCIFHSGRIPKTNETDAYRLGWGGQEHGYYYQYHPDTGTKTEYSQKRGKKRAMIQTCWRRLPKTLARALGPTIVREYP